jgi:hypothetical protein
VKKLTSAVPAGVFLAWLYFLGFMYVQAYYNDFSLQGRVATATVEGLLMSGATALSVGSKPWYLQLPLALELVVLAGMYWLAAHLVPEKRRLAQRMDRRRRGGGRTAQRFSVWSLAACIVLLALGSAWLAHHEGTVAARQVRDRFAAGGGMRTVFFANGRRVELGPGLGCDRDVCAYLANRGAFVVDRKRIAAEVPRRALR